MTEYAFGSDAREVVTVTDIVKAAHVVLAQTIDDSGCSRTSSAMSDCAPLRRFRGR